MKSSFAFLVYPLLLDSFVWGLFWGGEGGGFWYCRGIVWNIGRKRFVREKVGKHGVNVEKVGEDRIQGKLLY